MGMYSKGAKFERDVIKHLEKKGMYCIRSAGSKGIVDVIAIRRHCGMTLVHMIQCKYGNATMSKKDKNELVELADKFGFIPIYAHKRKNAKHLKIDLLKKVN